MVTGRGSGIDDLAWMRKCAAIRDALRRGPAGAGRPLKLLGAVGGADLAAATGFLLQCAVRRTPVVLDGVVSAACALVAQRVAFRAPDWWLAGQTSGEPGRPRRWTGCRWSRCSTMAYGSARGPARCSRCRC